MSNESLAGRVALVTGAGRRVGRAIALELARAGADVVIHCFRSESAARETAAGVEKLGRSAWIVQADLSSPEGVDALFDKVVAIVPRLDLLVNSASGFERLPLQEITPERWDAMLALNLRAPYLASRRAAPLMQAAGGGVIINIADVAGVRPWPNHLHYVVSKAGLISMTQCLALELAPAIRVNAVAPGTVLPAPNQGNVEEIRKRTPLGRLATPEDVGRAVVFLAGGPDSITGQVIIVDGGRLLYARE
jgi:NAD(P)-dependent dehydrogenase (short-subunit alcohol dehydrogenase family)